MGTNKAFPLEGKVGPKDPDEGEPAAAPPGRENKLWKNSVYRRFLADRRTPQVLRTEIC